MKKLSLLMISFLAGVSVLLSSCEEDNYGPAPVDVTAQYSNKISTTNPNLAISYNGASMVGKAVDFSTVTGETANVTLYDVLPGEPAIRLVAIPLKGDAEGYSFATNGQGSLTGVSFRVEGRVANGKLTLNVHSIQMANAELWAKDYTFSKVEQGPKEMMEQDWWTETYTWVTKENQLVQGACYFNGQFELNETGYNAMGWGVKLQNLLSYLLPQLVQDIRLGSDGSISATTSEDALKMDPTTMMQFLLFGKTLDEATLNGALEGRTYTEIPANMAQWYTLNGQLMLKLDLGNIIAHKAATSERYMDPMIINGLLNAVSKMDALQVKKMLTQLNQQMNNDLLTLVTSIDDASFKDLFQWMMNGIPMDVKVNDKGQTIVYLNKENMKPVLALLPQLAPMITGMLPENMAALAPMISTMLTTISTLFVETNAELGLSLAAAIN